MIQRLGRQSGNRNQNRRAGAVAVEMAMSLPVLILLILAPIEISNGIYVKQTLTEAAYEGAREASRAGTQPQEVVARVNEVLASRGVSGSTISISPNLGTTITRGTNISVTVRTSGSNVSINPLHLFSENFLEKTVQVIRN